MTYAQLLCAALPVPPTPMEDLAARLVLLRGEVDRLTLALAALPHPRRSALDVNRADLVEAAVCVRRALDRTRAELRWVEAEIEALDAGGPAQAPLPLRRCVA